MEILAVGHHDGDMEIDADAKHRAYAFLKALEERAGPGTVIVSSQAAGALARRFELARIESGGVATGEVYRLVAASDADRGLTGFVGREAELRLCRDRFDRARAGLGQVVSVVGEAGIGSPGSCRSYGVNSRAMPPGWRGTRSPSAGRWRFIR